MAAFLFLLFLLSEAASDLIMLSVHPGEDAILPCRAADVPIRAVEWTRPNLEPPQYVLFYRDGHLDTTHLHPSYKGRVQLLDRHLKDGDVSLILKNVRRHDRGTYECRVASVGFTRTKRAILDSEPIRTIQLQITDSNSGQSKDENSTPVGLYIGLGVFFALLFLT
ncbi:butyrophilin-like protein 2 [Perca fluviatilis]|uniref:butyrophilin-like protein 2 n=1 Tax=Perca fluviatilis TaxID=8168 RepID=UPI001965C63C|nr:butyrophilin-like protein 2 [Perca fluviatilis]XP_039678394.1 butyrophilin-like protein 2 [Perca fluviatilis]XP_039678395.1 butyrophilin-like protein 2 [Perca fluviatilis]